MGLKKSIYQILICLVYSIISTQREESERSFPIDIENKAFRQGAEWCNGTYLICTYCHFDILISNDIVLNIFDIYTRYLRSTQTEKKLSITVEQLINNCCVWGFFWSFFKYE